MRPSTTVAATLAAPRAAGRARASARADARSRARRARAGGSTRNFDAGRGDRGMLARELRRRWRGSVSIGGADARAVMRAGARGTRASAREDGGEAGEGRASTSYASSAAYDADDEFNERLAKGYADDDVERFARGLSRLSVAGGGAPSRNGARTFASQASPAYEEEALASSAPRIRGEIKRVTFHSRENGYTVARMEVDSSCELPPGALATPKRRRKGAAPTPTVTVVGTLPGASEGQMLELIGQWKENTKYGVEFLITGAPTELKPSSEDGMLRYLSGGALPGCGKVTAQRLVDHFGVDLMDVLNSPDAAKKLCACDGIGPKTAIKLKTNWDESRGKRDAAVFLEKHGVPLALAQRAAAQYGPMTEDLIRDNPFEALGAVRGATFHRVDALASRLGKAPNDPARLGAAIIEVLSAAAVSSGHAYLPWSKIVDGVRALLGQSTITDELSMQAAADAMRTKGEIRVQRLPTASTAAGSIEVFEGDWSTAALYTSAMHSAEVAVASDVINRIRRPKIKVDSARVERWLEAAAQKEGWRTLSETQKDFVRLALESPVSILTGGPGTGKTFATHVIVRLWRAMGKSVVMCAPTGRAAQRLMEITTAGRDIANPVTSSTIHRLLEFKAADALEGMEDDGPMQALSYKGRFSRDAKNPIQADVVVVDESSMLDLPLAAALLAAVPPSAQVVFVGDADQLPSVGPGSLLRDLLAARNVPSIALTDIFRQAAASGIVRAAHAINSGAFLPLDIREQRHDVDMNELRIVADAQDVDLPPIDPDLKPDCLWVSLPSETNASVEAVLDHILSDILPARGFSPKDLQVLSPMRRGVASTGSLNNWLQTSLNPSCESKKEVTVGGFSGDVTFREGDRVLQQRNDYDKEVFNGDLGVIQRIDTKAGTAIVSFGADFKEVSYTKGELRDLIPAYAMTIHKAQGSEYRAVVLVMTNAHKPLLRRELLYTGVTRAKELLVIVAPRTALAAAIDTAGKDRRCTGLVDRLAAAPQPKIAATRANSPR